MIEQNIPSSLDIFIVIGRSVKAFGKEGRLLVEIENSHLKVFHDVDAVFLEYKANIIPFFIKDVKEKGQSLLVRFESVNAPEYWSDLTDYKIRIHKKDLNKNLLDHNQIAPETLEGFTIKDQDQKTLGKIHEIRAFPQQVMAVILREKEELFIPLVDDWIEEIDFSLKIVNMILPDGITDL